MSMKARIEPRERFWREKKYRVVESGNGWQIERCSDSAPNDAPDLEALLNQFFKKRKKWE